MPDVDSSIMRRREAIARELRAIVGDEWVLDSETERRPYECDGLTAYSALPLLVVLPDTTDEVSRVLRYCHAAGIKVVPRGSGTSLSGGALPLEDGILLVTARMNRVVEVDAENRVARVQPGVQNVRVTEAVRSLGLCYMPDPSSQAISTIGGNVAENSGGVHCLKYGVTSNHVTGMEIVLMTGDMIRLGGAFMGGADGEFDLCGALIGSEGLLAVVTEITVRLTPEPPVARVLSLGFADVEAASHCVGAIIGRGIVPAGLEFVDRKVIDAVASLLGEVPPQGVEALLLCELDGTNVEVEALAAEVEQIAHEIGVVDVRISRTEAERERLWRGRKLAFGAMGKIARDVYVTDGTIPRGRLGEILKRIDALSRLHGLAYANCFHAGDGNLHPMVLFDSAKPGDLEKAEAFGADILRACVDLGGVLSGEHGIGVEKRDLMTYQFAPNDLAQQQRLKCAFDPCELLNPGKVFPTPCRCVELGGVRMRNGNLRFADVPRF
ncbi:FAD-linked oxidase C-terminal domain-containing protein [Burkholderia sp. Ac-20344]|uniref:FAD-linked oxidase C-terminal domain-containing protein n=1 Tax=Burkholderia sp. Ac-20344 TaxID=2703890 RepID=UPI001EB863A1|nr:FAD-linked oxidase C-terminal domain-containing protein [Burkholderia sp. Ac-20344]MBN3830317.1 FAD-binding protein [Burkholderia sp. Ac-20344]